MRYQMYSSPEKESLLVLMDDGGEQRVLNAVWNELASQGKAPAVQPSLDNLLASSDPNGLADQLEASFDRGLPLPDGISLEVPVSAGDVFCIGRNYAEHARELGNEVPGEPIVFMKPRNCLIPSGDSIVIPAGAEQVHHEGELVLVMGKGLQGAMDPSKAESAVFGVTLMNDVTDRARQNVLKAAGKPWLAAKGRMTFGPCGPAVRRFDATYHLADTKVQTHVNGELRQSGGPELWIFQLPVLLDYLSRTFGLRPGDLIATGTPAGVGPLVAGDRIEVSCEGVGVLSSPVVAANAE